MRISVEHDAAPADKDMVRQGLAEFNVARSDRPDDYQPLTIFIRDTAGAVRGGLLGATYWGWLYIEILWLPEDLRGQGNGTRLVDMAEDIARERGCHAAHLDTMSFQAPAFYRKLGYEEWGRLDDMLRGHTRFFLRKAL
jgi:GNAT superfamily N-acetyltransferase